MSALFSLVRGHFANLFFGGLSTVVLALVIAVPSVHYFLEKQYLAGILATLSEVTANQIMERVIAPNPTYWIYEESRLQTLLHPQMRGISICQCVNADADRLILAVGDRPAPPALRQRTALLDAGVVVGYLNTSVSLRPLLWRNLTLALIAGAVGALAVAFFSYFPLRRLRQAEQTVCFLAEHDALTGLLNRYALEPVFEQEVKRATRYGLRLSMLLFDIDHFKIINDVHGHCAGDRVLRRLAELVAGTIRSSDYLVRWGGEEFLLLLTHTDQAEARELAEKLRDLVAREDFSLGEPVTISLGLSTYRSGMSLHAYVERADQAMYRAKNAGRNCWIDAEAGDRATDERQDGMNALEPD
ncbi:GGDEF domain-containing protein [Thiocystis violascens]|uniref:diguanylate cyclase n=1 Tax=Thiocystis violascens (strain ATCC 17096 / DSM 198 / 6111) TaxID=765911 RepID=I3YG11_THIV6|nr:GGDEF domain-containing protein [Thiocystis violascens]AFL75929.1 diguanylate cyclase (GGDEF) domain-containing protein [Thiocystis violascens DSM 198]